MTRHTLSIIVATLLAMLAAACNNDVFIKPLKVSADEITLDADHPTARIDIEGEDWTLASDSSLPLPGSDGELCIDEPWLGLTARRTSGGIDLHLQRYIGRNPIEATVIVSDLYSSCPVTVRLLPTEGIEVLGVDYTLDSWGSYEPFTRTDVLYEVHYPAGVSDPQVRFLPLETVPTVYRFLPLLNDPLADLALDLGATVPLPSVGPYIWDWQLRGETGILRSEWTPLLLRHFPPSPETVEVPAGVPVAVKLLCDYECCSFQCRVRILAGGEEKSFVAILRMEMPVKIYAAYELL